MAKATKRKPPSKRGQKHPDPDKLTPFEARFVAELLACPGNQAEAARRAGSKAKDPRKVADNTLRVPRVAKAVEAARAKVASKLEITAEKVLEDLETARKGAMGSGQFGAAIKASELQGKHIGMFKERVEVSGAIQCVLDYRRTRGGS